MQMRISVLRASQAMFWIKAGARCFVGLICLKWRDDAIHAMMSAYSVNVKTHAQYAKKLKYQ